jgi:hypothetical protein
VQGAQNFFRTNLMQWPPIGPQQAGAPLHLTNRFYAPYAPTRSIYVYTSWAANDPLVHYTVGDLMPLIRTNRYEADLNPNSPIGNIGGLNFYNVGVGIQDPVNGRYEPWGGYKWGSSSSTNKFTISVKDPLVTSSDAWDFPTNKFANVGWLGRVHRGTPWQTVYLKSSSLDLPAWALWSGNGQMVTNFGQLSFALLALTNWVPDSVFSMPTNDWRLLDVFSTAFYENSALGKLDVNQSGLAAWSAVLSGVAVVTNTGSATGSATQPTYDVAIIQPAGYYNPFGPATNLPPVARIVNALNRQRASLTNQHQVFQHVGEILAVPELTVASPFLNTSTDAQKQYGISDAAYERIPQQTVGLLKCDHTPRFVVYSYGQTLRPAEHSLVTASAHFNLCTNYQITAETATRAVVRVEGAPLRPHAIIESFNVLPPD